jgi:hypothetical protein
MLKKALTTGATVVLAILASAGVASASEVNAAQVLPLPPIASPADPESTDVPDPDEESESTSDADSTSEPESDTTTDAESDTTDTESESTDSESDTTTEPEEETEPDEEPAPAPIEEAPSAGPLGLIESLVTSLFG